MNFFSHTILFKAAALIVIIGVAVLLALYAGSNESVVSVVQTFGYAGLFTVSVASGFNLAIPIPIIAFTPLFVEAGFTLWVVIVVISLGLTVGDVAGYLTGSIARDAAQTFGKRTILNKLSTIEKQYPYGPILALFTYVAFVPLPNEIIIIPLALLGYKLKTMFPAFLLGNIVFNTIYGLSGVTLFEYLL